jgi:hypothetical protein
MKKIINKLTNLLKKAKNSNLFIISVAIISALSGGIVATYAEQFIDSFLDISRVADTWNVEVDTANGEVKLAQRSCDNSVWFCDLTHICPGLMGDGSQLLVKRTNETSLQWKTSGTTCDTPECAVDGAQSNDNLTSDNTISFNSLYTYYPARDVCKVSGARLPTTAELQCIYYYRGSFGNNFGSSAYWTSTEFSTDRAWYVYFYNGDVSNYYKTHSYPSRCVRGW